MNPAEASELIRLCRTYVQTMQLPTPYPTTASAYAAWREAVLARDTPSEECEDAWFEFEHLAYHSPVEAWPLLRDLIESTEDEPALAVIALGPLETFVDHHGTEFATELEAAMASSRRFIAAMAAVDDLERHAALFARIRRFFDVPGDAGAATE